MKRLCVAVGVALAWSFVAGATPVSASTLTGPTSEVARKSSFESLRCNLNRVVTGSNVKQVAFCFFPVTPLSGEEAGLVDLRSRAGTDYATSALAMIFAGDNVVASSYSVVCFREGTWHIGPQASDPAVGDWSIPAGAAVFITSSDACPNVPLVGQNAPYNGDWRWANASCNSTGTTGLIGSWGRTCWTNYFGNTTMTAALTRGWENMPFFPGGTAPGSAFACMGLDIDGPPGDTPRAGGSTYAFTASWPGVVLYSLDWRFGGDAGWTQLVFQPITTSKNFTLTIPARLGGKSLVEAQLEFRCTVRSAGVDRLEYVMYGSDGIQSLPQVPNTCRAAKVQWPFVMYPQAGDVVPFWFELPGGPGFGPVKIEVAFQDPSGSSTALTAWETVEVVRSASGATITPYAADAVPTGTSGGFEVELVHAGSLSQIVLRCTSGGRAVLDKPWGSRKVPYQGALADDDPPEDCLDSVEFGVNPTTWVGGLFGTIGCAGKAMFVPSSADMAERLERFEGLRSMPPLQWADQGVDYVSGAEIEVQRWATHGPACVEVMGTDVCPRTWDNSAAVPGWLVSVLMLGLWSTVVMAVWRFF